ncbi:MAG TPA: PD-(D/E)XK nuclease family protein [Bosea sp. (in: a-proteobacteria)]
MHDVVLTEASLVEADLVQLVMNCPELRALEGKLSQFNIFKALRADQHELRHSNMLAWLVNPEEVHGFDDLFVRRWLMQLLHKASAAEKRPAGWVSPIVVDALDVERIEVHRELENIDLLFTIHIGGDRFWTICVENKVNSRQGAEQLQRYFDVVEKRFSASERRIYVFLTRDFELPALDQFIPVTYREVSEVLVQCLAVHAGSMGEGPRLLAQHYHQLLSEDFVDDSETAQLARQIYLKHKRAIDFIFENKSDPIFDATNAIEVLLGQRAEDIGIVRVRTNKGYIRFIPKAWDLPENAGGTAWGPNSRYLVIEVILWGKNVELHVTSGRAPDAWAEKLWQRMESAPFKQEWKKRPQHFIKPYKAKSNIATGEFSQMEPEDIASRIVGWVENEMKRAEFMEAIAVIAQFIAQTPLK